MRRLLVVGGMVVVVTAALAAAAERGRISGQVVRPDGSGVSGVAVALDGRPAAVSDNRGWFHVEAVEAGDHELFFTLGSNAATAAVTVKAGVTAGVRQEVDWEYVYAETLTVRGASRRVERVVDAPAAVTAVTPQAIALRASAGQLPRLLESSPGFELTQTDVWDFKINTRGLNTLLNRRIAVLVDGRDSSYALVGSHDWSTVTTPLDDLQSVELVRGPSSALYGANAFNGVLNLITRSPRDGEGGFVRFTGGDPGAVLADAGVYTNLGGGWFFKGLAGYRRNEDFAVSRNQTVEYSQPCPPGVAVDCLQLEAVPLSGDDNEIGLASLRVDGDLGAGRSLVVEGGYVEPKAITGPSAAGRFEGIRTEWPWGRIDLNAAHWNFLVTWADREVVTTNLSAGVRSPVEDSRWTAEFQTRWEVAAGRGRFVAGGSYKNEKVDTANAQGFQTLLERPVDADFTALYAQFDYDASDRLKLVVAARWDDGDTFSSQISPKAAAVYSISPGHTLRFGYNEAFLTPNYPELFVRVPLIPALDLSPFEAFCAPFEVACGFAAPTPVVAVGNAGLEVEKNRTFEIGYRGTLGDRAFLTIDLFDAKIDDFVRTGIPLVGTVLGRANPDFGPYQAPAGLPAEVAALLEATLAGIPFLGPFLTNPVPSEPLFALITLANAGSLDNRGAEIAVDWAIDDNWSLDANYAWLDFEFDDPLPATPLGFNAPENRANLGVHYGDDRLRASLDVRLVESFRWTEGLVNGVVPSFEVVNLVAAYDLTDRWEAGLNVSNLLDDEHIEVWSGSVLGRRALAHLAYRW
ncbi:MAG: TonB-dependent receptor [Thermoanaerobaculia bacterium]|nr:TonB-dependent receptor [Thermoanaerobaculia bacterium]